MTIKKNTSTKKNKKIEPPYLGDPVWESQHELSVSLLVPEDISWKEKALENEEIVKELKKEIKRLKKIIKGHPCQLCDIGDFRAACTCKEKE